jgi:hypothetical protein
VGKENQDIKSSRRSSNINKASKKTSINNEINKLLTICLPLSLSIPIYPYHITIMRFNIGMLVAFVATSQLAAAAPVPQWNGKNAEAAYVSKSPDSRDHKYRTLT